jgi:alpha-amylase/alpha-mannosidase (GH57 family)
MECFACVHCHFYQPPRENPWLEAVEGQDSAGPYHDWNERIARECYLPNGASRILGRQFQIAGIVNNYARISFNFGPTLLSWMEEHEPEGYQRILDGDRQSKTLFSGHGAALAQAYNHIILPLANSRDKRTQILWGIKDFRSRFQRDPEGMWLPETAVDAETLEVLSGEGIQFTILAPSQAAQLRPEKGSSWIDLEYGIDSRHAYACSLPSGASIGLFFYDGALATAVAFERLLSNGENFARRLLSRYDPEGDSAQLMHVATDGETYGHHHAHGDMALAYALQYIEENRLATLTNYGEYFAQYPPAQEVRIKEKTAWSCIHGVSRWEDDCGCNSGVHPQWDQKWRHPLRRAFDWLRDELATDFAREARQLLADPWRARDEYIEVVLDRIPARVNSFLAQHCRHSLTHDEEVRTLRMLEMQRHLMLMYTSCGWFFDEPTGPETVQVLRYAARAVQLGQQLFGKDLEEQFLSRLESVGSNIHEFGNGRAIYERFVMPGMLDLPGVAAHFAISSFFEEYRESAPIYSYRADLQNVQTLEYGKLRLAAGRARITSRITHSLVDFDFAVLYSGGHNLRAGIAPVHRDFATFVEQLRIRLAERDLHSFTPVFERYFGKEIYSLKSLFHDERRRIVTRIVDSKLADIDRLYRSVYEEHTSLIGFLREIWMPLPPILHVSSGFVLNNEIRRCLENEEIEFARMNELLATAQQHGVSLDATLPSLFHRRLDGMMNRWKQSPFDLDTLAQLQPLVELMRIAPFEADLWAAQNSFYEVMVSVASQKPNRCSPEWLNQFRRLGENLGVGVSQRYPAVVTSSDPEPPPIPARETTGTKVTLGSPGLITSPFDAAARSHAPRGAARATSTVQGSCPAEPLQAPDAGTGVSNLPA